MAGRAVGSRGKWCPASPFHVWAPVAPYTSNNAIKKCAPLWFLAHSAAKSW